MGKIKKNIDDKEKRLLLVQQDLKVAKALAGNDKKLRERVLKNLKTWFQHRSSKIPLTKEDFLRLWKGLFYTMWMADKPLVQEECAEKIAKLIHFSSPESSLLFFKCALVVMTTEWFGIDQLRLDKFLMFVRRILRQALEVLRRNNWKLELVTEFGNILLETVLKKDNSTHLGLTMHVTEIYLEELAKVSNGKLEKHLVAEFIKPFVKQLSVLEDNRQITHIRKYMFHHLLHQSDEGMEYNVRFAAWKGRGFPGGTIESMEKVEASEDEDISDLDEEYEEQEEKPLDPRAGHVDVELPQLQFDPLQITRLLLEHKFAEGSTSQTRKVITKLIQDFEKLSKGDFPLGIKEIRFPEYDGHSTTLKKSVNRLVKFEKQILADSSKNRKRKLKNRKNSDNSRKSKTDIELPGMAEMFKDKLQKFIEKSEGNLTNGTNAKKRKLSLEGPKAPKRKALKKQPKDDVLDADDCKYENHFRRNSGMWIVHRYDDLDNSQLSERSDSFISDDSNNKIGKDKMVTENGNVKHTSNINKNQKHNEPLFPQNEWDLPPKEGEVEIFVPSNKYKKKMEKIAEKTGKNVNNLDNCINNIKTRYSLNNDSDSFNNLAKKRLSLDASLVKNPFAKNGITPKNEKKVKIDLKLNRSQEIHEHQAQLRSSPAIPYDANKRPLKPLLKPNAVSSPINPFYKRKLKLL